MSVAQSYFDQLKKELPVIKSYAPARGAEKYFIAEVLRFHSIAGTILQSFPDPQGNIDSRIITHILTRSLLEAYFWIIYIFDDKSTIDQRFDDLLTDFKSQYSKLYNEQELPKNGLEEPDPSWAKMKFKLDLKSMLDTSENDYQDKLGYLYFVYRITSFDTHAKSLEPLFDESFKKSCMFPVLKLPKVFDLIANQYLVVWESIKQ